MADALQLLEQWRDPEGNAELLLKRSRSRQRMVSERSVETAAGREAGVAVRVVLHDGRSSLVSAAAPGSDRLTTLFRRARQLAAASAPDPHLSLPGPPPGAPADVPGSDGPPEPFLGEDEAKSLLSRLLGAGTRTVRVVQAWLREGRAVNELAGTAGFHGRHCWYTAGLGVLMAGIGPQPLVHEELFTGAEPPLPRPFLERALARATGLAGPPVDLPGSTNVLVLSPEAAAPLLLALGSRFVPRQDVDPPSPGARITAPGITLVDDGRHPGGLRSAPFDGEGSPTTATVLVEEGLFRSLVHDRRSASRAGVSSTGNAVRDSYRQWPAPGLSTLVLRPTPGLGEDDLLSDISRGYFALDAAQPDPDRLESGIFSTRLRGRLVQGGRLLSPAGPVRLRLPLDELLPRLSAAAGRPRLVALDGCAESPLLRLEGVRLDPC
jgi:PmbA protein